MILIKTDQQDVSTLVRIIDATSGLPEEGVTSATAGLALWYRRDGYAKAALSLSDLGAVDAAHADGGIVHVDDGYYRVDLPDAATAGGVNGVLVGGTATGMMVVGNYLQLTDSLADLWNTRTLTQSAATVSSSVSGTTITVIRGDTLSVALTGLGDLTGYVSIDFTVKEEKQHTDAQAILRIRLNATGLNDGLLRFNGAEVDAGDVDEGSITIDDLDDGNITVALSAAYTDDLVVDTGLYYDVQLITASAVTTMALGRLSVTSDVTRLIA
jgi:hypothetical protein